jgi:hypothetical protein
MLLKGMMNVLCRKAMKRKTLSIQVSTVSKAQRKSLSLKSYGFDQPEDVAIVSIGRFQGYVNSATNWAVAKALEYTHVEPRQQKVDPRALGRRSVHASRRHRRHHAKQVGFHAKRRLEDKDSG